ncbi:MAG TPA: hypothetical protein VG165_02525 [Solirubrobacteraceae bacterium]|jgi:hypothetical protein|nr:hypothetical protein [Solirubrobacteraceae bacterium]
MGRLLLSFVAVVSLAGAAAVPGVASARAVPTCHVPGGEVVAFRHGAALVTSNTIVKGSTRSVAYYGCLRGVGKIILIDRGNSAVGPENFAIAGNYLSFVQVGSAAATGVAKMSIEQWNLRTGKRTLNPNAVSGVTYETGAAPPKFTASTQGYLAWVITTGVSLDPTNPGPVNTVTDLMVFDGHAASVADSFNSQTDTAPAGTILSGIFTNIAISGKVLRWERLGQAMSAPIG